MNKPQIRRVTGGVGAEVKGVDLATLEDPDAIRLIRGALLEHGVVFFRDQSLGNQDYVRFARAFGRPVMPTSGIIPPLPGSAEIAVVSKEPGQARNVGGSWHTDQVYRKNPTWGTMLLARQVPEAGGDTLFASLSAAFDALSEGLRRTLETLDAVHSNAGVQARMKTGRAPDPDVVHPVVIRHPETGRRVLYVNPAYTVRFDGWTEAESRPLLEFLYQHAQRPEFACRFRWEVGSLAFWDNYQTWHFAVNDYDPGERVMHRIVVEGIPLNGRSAAAAPG